MATDAPYEIQKPYWVERNPEERALLAIAEVDRLFDEKASRQLEDDQRMVDLYEGKRILQPATGTEEATGTVTNTVEQVVDSFVNDLVRQRIRIQFLTEEGSYEQREAAEAMSKAVEGQLFDADFYGDEGIELARDGVVRPCGAAVKVTPDLENGRTLVERIRAHRIFADSRDARMGRPRMLTYVDDFPVELLQARFPKQAQEIGECAELRPDNDDADLTRDSGRSWRVSVAETWHLPSKDLDSRDDKQWGIDGSEPDHDGRHMLLTKQIHGGKPIVLLDKPWAIQRFPVVVWRPLKMMREWRGRTIVERLMAIQNKLDKYQRRVDAMMNIYARVIMYVNRNAQMTPSTLSNDYMRVFEGDLPAEQAFKQVVPGAVPPDLFARIQQLEQYSKDYSRKTELSMMGKRPAGVEAGVALRLLRDEEDAAHVDFMRTYETFHVNIGRAIVDCNRLVAAHNPKFKVQWGESTSLRKVEWRKIDLDDLQFLMRPWPTNLFSSSPAAKLQQLVELFQSTGLSKEQALPVLSSQFPDIAALFADQNAFVANIERILGQVVREKKITPETEPSIYLDLQLAKRMVLARINAAEVDGRPPEVVGALQQWHSDVLERTKELGAQERTIPEVTGPMPETPTGPGALPAPAIPKGVL